MIFADFNQRFGRQAAVGDEFLGVGKGDHVIGSAVEDHRVWFERFSGVSVLPRWIKQD